MQEFTLSLKNFCAGIASDSAKREHLSCEALLNMYVTPAGKLKHVNWIGILDLNAILSTINAVSDNIQMSYLDTYSGNVLGNDAGTDLVVTAVDGNPLLVDAWIEETDGTLLRISSDGTISIDAEEINSVTTTFTHSYTITNAVGSDIGTVNVQLSSVLSPVSDSVSTDDATIITGNVLDNDTGVGMYVNAVDGLLANIGVAQTLTNGTVVTINTDGSYTVDPTGCDTSGGDVVDTIEYSVSNGEAEASAWLTVTVTATADDGIPTDSLVTWYTMDDLSMSDSSGNGNDGTLYGGSTVAGVVGNALQFNGTTAHGALANTAEQGISGFSLSFWFNVTWRTNTYDSLYMMQHVSGQADRVRLFHYGDMSRGLCFNVGAVTINDIGGVLPTAGANHHCVAQYNATTGDMELYIDNTMIASGVTTTGLVTPLSPPLIGKTPSVYPTNPNLSINGWIDQRRFYSRPLTAGEIAALYAEGAS